MTVVNFHVVNFMVNFMVNFHVVNLGVSLNILRKNDFYGLKNKKNDENAI